MSKFSMLTAGGIVLLLSACANEPTRASIPSSPVTVVAPRAESSLWPATAPSIRAVSAILIDARTGKTLYQKNADEPRQVASTQKLVTALVVAEKDPLDGSVTISHSDTTVEPTTIGMRSGEVYPRSQLFRAMLVHSANDCASALAHAHSGTLSAFADEMNEMAERCGATHSHFVNPHGLPASQHSTARDMARIAFRAYRNPDIREAVALRGYIFHFARGGFTPLSPTDRLLLTDPYFNGMKTGYTEAAGKCLISSYSKNGRDLILVQLGSHAKYIFNDAQKLIGWAMSH